jgi:hypothetical protein
LFSLWSTTCKSVSSTSPSKPNYIFPLPRAFSYAFAAVVTPSNGALDPSRLCNVVVIAHVDHNKTTLMDRLLHQCSADIPHTSVPCTRTASSVSVASPSLLRSTTDLDLLRVGFVVYGKTWFYVLNCDSSFD